MPAGRPNQESSLDSVRGQLTAPLYMNTPAWTSSDLAKFSGVSQSSLARTWRDFYPVAKSGLVEFGRLHLIGVLINQQTSLLIFATNSEGAIDNSHTGFMRSPRRRALQTIVAADLLRAALPKTEVHLFINNVQRAHPNSELLLASSHEELPTDFRSITFKSEQAWQAALHDLVISCVDSPPAELNDVQKLLMQWARKPNKEIAWIAQPSELAVTQRALTRIQSLSDALAEQALEVILVQLRNGTLRAGSRVTESNLSRAMRTSRNQAREAIRALASSGLLELEQNRSALIPTPTGNDVIDIYAARRALGNVIMRKTSTLNREQLAAAQIALDEMLTISKGGKSMDTGFADLHFQDVLGVCTGMRNIPEMMHELASQLTLFIEILGIKYSYPVPDMYRDNAEILKHIKNQDTTNALKAWNKKMDDALHYMTRQLDSWKLAN